MRTVVGALVGVKVVMKGRSTSAQNGHAPSWLRSSAELSRPPLKCLLSLAARWVDQLSYQWKCMTENVYIALHGRVCIFESPELKIFSVGERDTGSWDWAHSTSRASVVPKSESKGQTRLNSWRIVLYIKHQCTQYTKKTKNGVCFVLCHRWKR